MAVIEDVTALIALDSFAARNPARAKEIHGWVAAGECFVAEMEGKLTAYAVLNYHFFNQGLIEILMVGESFRRQGIGEKLLRYLMSLCRTPKLWVTTNLSNQPMQHLLYRMDFKPSGFINDLDEGDPELVFFTRIV